MLWTIFVVLLILALLGFINVYSIGNFVYLILLAAVVVLIIQLVTGRRSPVARFSSTILGVAAPASMKVATLADFVQRARFTTALPASMTAAQFVDTLNTNAGNPLSQAERDQLVNDLSSGMKTRAQALRAIADRLRGGGENRRRVAAPRDRARRHPCGDLIIAISGLSH